MLSTDDLKLLQLDIKQRYAEEICTPIIAAYWQHLSELFSITELNQATHEFFMEWLGEHLDKRAVQNKNSQLGAQQLPFTAPTKANPKDGPETV